MRAASSARPAPEVPSPSSDSLAEDQNVAQAPGPLGDLDVEAFAETSSRYFAAEFVGAFMHTLLVDLFRWTQHYQFTDMFKVMNPGQWPKVKMQCIPGENNTASSCRGDIHNPIAGSVLPNTYLMTCLLDAMAFGLCLMSAPGASLMPNFLLMYCLAGVKAWRTFLPSLLGQLLGVVVANLLMYFLIRDAVSFQTTVFFLTTAEVESLVEELFGLYFPEDDVSNLYAFCYTLMSGVFFVWLFTAIVHRSVTLNAFGQVATMGMGMLVFQTGFGMNGLGNMPNPAQFLCTATFLTYLGFKTWRKHDHYAMIVPLWAPLIGVVLGSLLYRVYMGLIYHGRITIPEVSRKSWRRRSWTWRQ